jgi:hypothetical protein
VLLCYSVAKFHLLRLPLPQGHQYGRVDDDHAERFRRGCSLSSSR